MLAEEHHHPELLAHFREQFVAPRRLLLRSVLELARERNELAAGVDLDRAVNMLIGSCYAGYLAGDEMLAAWPERTVDALLRGLLKPSR